MFSINLPDEADTVRLARCFAQHASPGLVVYLRGELGVGKTAFVRAWLQAKGITDRIKSPSFAILEVYEVDQQHFLHLDLYRITDAVELTALGLRDYIAPSTTWLIEWPEHGRNHLPRADIILRWRYQGEVRKLYIYGNTDKGKELISSRLCSKL